MSNVTKQKLMLSFISLTLIVAFVGFLMMNESLAWFSNNKTVSANGLSVSAQSTSNLIISDDVEDIEDGIMKFSVSFPSDRSRTDMIAVTRDTSYGAPYLKYLTNHYAVGNESGLVKTGETLKFETVPVATNGIGPYYIDYVVYIASTEKALEVDSLVATIVSPVEIAEENKFLNAASIDFYLNGAFVDTLSVANRQSGSVVLLNKGVVPLNTDGCLTVTMRCYFDGALTYMDGTTERAYINSYNVKTTGINLGVHFAATEAAEETN